MDGHLHLTDPSAGIAPFLRRYPSVAAPVVGSRS